MDMDVKKKTNFVYRFRTVGYRNKVYRKYTNNVKKYKFRTLNDPRVYTILYHSVFYAFIRYNLPTFFYRAHTYV